MKKQLKLLLALLVFSNFSGFAQRFQYEDPSNPPLKRIDVATALAEADDAESYVGFHAGFIPADKVQGLLEDKHNVGVRIYNALETSSTNNTDLIAVAVNPNGTEIGRGLKKWYLLLKHTHKNGKFGGAKEINRFDARTCLRNIVSKERNLDRFSAYFSEGELAPMIDVEKEIGLKIIPIITDEHRLPTLAVCPAELDVNGIPKEVPGSYYWISSLPCPMECGDLDKYLVWPYAR